MNILVLISKLSHHHIYGLGTFYSFLNAVSRRSVKHDACCSCLLGLQLITLFLARDNVLAEQLANKKLAGWAFAKPSSGG